MPHLPGQPNISPGPDGGQPTTRDANVRAHSAPPHAGPRLKFTGPRKPPEEPFRPTGSTPSNPADVAIIPDPKLWRPRRRDGSDPDTDD